MASTCAICGKKVGMLQSAYVCKKCGSYMHTGCAVRRKDGDHCPNCDAKV